MKPRIIEIDMLDRKQWLKSNEPRFVKMVAVDDIRQMIEKADYIELYSSFTGEKEKLIPIKELKQLLECSDG
jgi:hypothetical protein